MDKANKEFNVNPNIDKFDIVIRVKQNCLTIDIFPYGVYEPNYYEILGAMDAIKTNMILTQTDKNKNAFKRAKKAKEAING